MINKKDLFKKFNPETKTVNVKAWGEAPVEIRKLTIKEQADVNSLLYGNLSIEEAQEGTAHIDITAVQEAQILSVSYALVNPQLSVDEIKSMPSDFLEGIGEISEALNSWSNPK